MTDYVVPGTSIAQFRAHIPRDFPGSCEARESSFWGIYIFLKTPAGLSARAYENFDPVDGEPFRYDCAANDLLLSVDRAEADCSTFERLISALGATALGPDLACPDQP
jgi:hypothetical protein